MFRIAFAVVALAAGVTGGGEPMPLAELDACGGALAFPFFAL